MKRITTLAAIFFSFALPLAAAQHDHAAHRTAKAEQSDRVFVAYEEARQALFKETCYRGGCALPAAQKGCGGMNENDVTL
jgi:hypothetical protein